MLFQPKSVGPLTIQRKVGSDGVADTYDGVLRVDADRRVVIRRLREWLTTDATLLSSVEARSSDLLVLRHPRLVRILDVVASDGEHYIVEEHVRGIHLAALVEKLPREHGKAVLPPNVFLHFALQLCTSIEALHNRRGRATGDEPMLHRAIRPQAISISVEGSVRLGGYGLLTTPNLVPKRERRGRARERTSFLAPEQVEDGRPTSTATDVFSLGLVLHFMLTGEVLFDADSDLQAMLKIRACDVADRLTATRSVLPGIERILHRCLAQKPSRRYQSVNTLRGDLRALLEAYDNSRISDDVLDVLAMVGLEPVSRAEPPVSPRRSGPPSAGAATTLHLPPLPERDDETEDMATDPGVARASRQAVSSALGDDVVDPQVGADHISPLDEDHPPVSGHDDAEKTAETIYTRPIDLGPAMPAPRAALPTLDDDAPPVVEQTARSIPAIPEITARRITPPLVDPDPVRHEAPPEDNRPAPIPLLLVAAAAVVMLGGAFRFGMYLANDMQSDGAGVQQRSVVMATPPDASEPMTAATPREASGTTDEASGTTDEASGTTDEASGTTDEASGTDALAVAPRADSDATHASDAVATAESVDVDVVDPPRPAPVSTNVPTGDDGNTAQENGETTQDNAVTPSAEEDTVTASEPDDVVEPDADRAVTSAEAVVEEEGSSSWTPPVRLEDTEALARRAASGSLSDADKSRLASLDPLHPDFTRARVWLYEDATLRGVLPERQQHIKALMGLPENTYNPVFLVEEAQVAIATKNYEQALDKARRAEQHWARLPSSAVFHRKAMIYELQAGAWYGLWGKSGGDDPDALLQSIRSWERYRQHVSRRDPALAARADEQITKLSGLKDRARVE